MFSFEYELVLGLLIIIVLAIIAFLVNSLDSKGLVSSIIIGITIFLGRGWSGLIIIMVFFTISTFSTRLKYNYKRKLGFGQEKGGARGWRNTLANGGLPAIFAFSYIILDIDLLLIAFLGAIATSTADTLATEIGLLSRQRPRLITNLGKKVGAGTSGGVSILGEIMVLLGSLLIGIIAVMVDFSFESYYEIIIISIIGGLAGANFDSVLGATIQGINKCRTCGIITEAGLHHSKPTLKIKGIKLIGNNTVNFISSIMGATIAIISSLVI
jgi:uncharacterized protein (TIGR00297 family)